METVTLMPKIVAQTEGLDLVFPGETMKGKLMASETGGQFSVACVTVEPGFGPPPHIHSLEDELFIVVEGEVEFLVDGTPTIATAGTTVFAPRHVSHTYKGAGSGPAKFFVIVTGDNFEKFIVKWVEMLNDGSFSPEKGAQLGAEHGIQFLPPTA